MNEKEIIKLMESSYNPTRWVEYRRAYIFYHPKASIANCNCNVGNHYQWLKEKMKTIKKDE